MATQLQLRKGTKIQNDTFTGAEGELTLVSDTKGLRLHDGHTTGGFEVPVLVEVQRATAENNYTWFRKWSDGWVEMGGQSVTNSGNPTAVNLPVTLTSTLYFVFIQGETGTDGYSNAQWQVMPIATTTSPKSTSKFYAQGSISGYNLKFYWRVEGRWA
jgi:hypothetical protein